MRLIACVSTLMLAILAFSACGSGPPVFPDNAFVEHPKIHTIAVSPFLMPEAAVKATTKRFTVQTCQASDGTMLYYSVDFAQEYARGLSRFPGVRVITPEDVYRRWQESKATAERNPMLKESHAREIGASLGADAILVGEVRNWDMFRPDLTMEWRLLATNQSGGGTSIIDTERSGTGGQAFKDYTKIPVFQQTRTLNAEDIVIQKEMANYGRSIEVPNAYRDSVDFIRHEPWPRFLHFAAWAHMTDAYNAHRPKK